MITATYHNMLSIVNKLFGGLGANNLKKYVVKKGSISLDGISLTVVDVKNNLANL